MVSEENRNGLLITVPLYFAFLAFAAYWAYKRIETMKHSGISDKLTAHYLGGRDFGPLLRLTWFTNFTSSSGQGPVVHFTMVSRGEGGVIKSASCSCH